MAEKTNLTSDEVANLLMTTPLSVYEWVQKGMLHAAVVHAGKAQFGLEDVQHFARDMGISICRPDKSKLRLLIIDDDVRMSRSLVELFDTLSETIEATTVHSAFEAGRVLYSFRPDVVLLSSFMSSQDGFEICRRIKSDHVTRHVRLIALMDSHDSEYKQRMHMMGVEACLSKPLNHQALFQAIGVCLDQPIGINELQSKGHQ